jgi:hypothetical protein
MSHQRSGLLPALVIPLAILGTACGAASGSSSDSRSDPDNPRRTYKTARRWHLA